MRTYSVNLERFTNIMAVLRNGMIMNDIIKTLIDLEDKKIFFNKIGGLFINCL